MKKIFTAFLIFVSVNLYAQLSTLIVLQSNNPAPGKIFYSNIRLGGGGGNISHITLFNNDGSVNFSRQMTNRTTDFKRQKNGLLTYCSAPNILIPVRNFYSMDSNFNVIDSFNVISPLPTDTFYTDSHDFQMLANGNVLMVGTDYRMMDMSGIVPGGHTNARVLGYVIQEQDPDGNVVFEWNTFDHFLITDAIGQDLTANDLDPWHWNAVEEDADGNLLLSFRHSSEITKLSRATGNIIWRLGGKRNQFRFINDPVSGDTMQHFSYQHDIRRLPNGNITLFDNGNMKTPRESRAVEYSLNEVSKTCTRVWDYKNFPPLYGAATGSAQRLSNGNTFISWGNTGRVTEVTPQGTIALELQNAAPGVYSYRTYKYELGVPALNLRLSVVPQGYFKDPITNNNLNMRDTVRVYLRSNSVPYNIVDSAKALIDTVSATGTFTFYHAQTGNYYMVVKHRNSIESWSKSGGQLLFNHLPNEYSFISSQSQAFGNNQVLIRGVYCIYSGDVNQNGMIDGTDALLTDNSSANYITGYVATDVTGDRIVDGSDALIVDNNAHNFIGVIRP